MLVVIIGVSVLALDGSRYMSLQTQLQNGADALALAGAAELDRTPTAIERATRAINRLVTNSSLFGSESDRNVRVARINFLRTLPPRDSDPILPGNRTSDPTLAAFVEVTVEPIRLRTILPASIFGGSNVLTAGAQAVAGFDQVVCDFTPIFVCNPFETRRNDLQASDRGPGQCQQRSGGATQTHPAYRNSGKDRSIRPRGFRICHADDGFFASAFLRPHYGRWHRPGHSRITTANLPAFERS